ncbi:MAG: Glyoxalase/Bleomycin resistance protein/Dioxygenase superfamily [Pseudobdellovibrio sp.]|jgi:predicted enzyme related to lactoylglutathione lyase|nr:Glyoxalase/Bleomycin resistance protein/Dioxygenase superfamily [Pseudobdellovibrio sp.]
MFKRYSHPMLYVTDLARAVEWYKSKLGFKENFVVPNAYASLRHEGMNFRLDLHPTEASSKDVGFGCINYFVPADFDKAIADLQAKGVKVGTPKREGESSRFVTFWDSEGNALGLEEAR